MSKEQSMTVHQQLQGTCLQLAELCQIFGNSHVWHKRPGLLFLYFFSLSFLFRYCVLWTLEPVISIENLQIITSPFVFFRTSLSSSLLYF